MLDIGWIFATEWFLSASSGDVCSLGWFPGGWDWHNETAASSWACCLLFGVKQWGQQPSPFEASRAVVPTVSSQTWSYLHDLQICFKHSQCPSSLPKGQWCFHISHHYWYSDWIFSNPQVIDRNMENDTLKLPITTLRSLASRLKTICSHKHATTDLPIFWRCRFNPPTDGLPVVQDWLTCWQSMVTGTIDLGREPLSCNARISGILNYHNWNVHK